MPEQDMREKIIKGLECCTTRGFSCIEYKKCPYGVQTFGSQCVDSMLRDVLVLLKAQEPVEPVFERQFMSDIEIYDCGKCGASLGAKGIAKYCMKCGQAVKWK